MQRKKRTRAPASVVAPQPPVVAPDLPPVVRRGDVAASLLNDLGELFRVAQHARALAARLETYEKLFPARHTHVVAFLGGNDSP